MDETPRPQRTSKLPSRYVLSPDMNPKLEFEQDEDVKPQLASSPPSEPATFPHDEKPQLGKRALSPPAQDLFRCNPSESGSPEPKKVKKEVKGEVKEDRGAASDDDYVEIVEPEQFDEAQLGPQVIPPARRRGREISWPRNVKVCATTTPKETYKLSLPYLNTLGYEYSKRSAGWPMTLYSEHQVQQAAWDQRGGEAYFRAYIQRLHNTAVTKAMNAKKAGKSYKFPPELDETERPLAFVPYEKEDVPDNWDNYVPSPRKRKRYSYSYGGCCG